MMRYIAKKPVQYWHSIKLQAGVGSLDHKLQMPLHSGGIARAIPLDMQAQPVNDSFGFRAVQSTESNART